MQQMEPVEPDSLVYKNTQSTNIYMLEMNSKFYNDVGVNIAPDKGNLYAGFGLKTQDLLSPTPICNAE